MVEFFLQMPMWLQIFLSVAMVVGLIVLWRFKYIVAAVAVGAVAIFKSLGRKNK